MGRKPPKKSRPRSKKNLSEMEQLVDRGRVAVEAQMVALEALIEELSADKGGDQRLWDKAVTTTNSLSKSIAALSAEQRQLEKHTSLSLEKLSPEDEDAVVMEHLSEIPRGRRRAFLEYLQGLDDQNDLLAL